VREQTTNMKSVSEKMRCVIFQLHFRAAIKITFSTSGSLARSSRSRRSHAIDSIPCASSASGIALSLKRETPITRIFLSAATAERRMSCARVGPIFPPTPRIRTSPCGSRMAATSASVGRDIRSSSCCRFSIFISPQFESCSGVDHSIVIYD
jgi:hypothetical protein